MRSLAERLLFSFVSRSSFSPTHLALRLAEQLTIGKLAQARSVKVVPVGPGSRDVRYRGPLTHAAGAQNAFLLIILVDLVFLRVRARLPPAQTARRALSPACVSPRTLLSKQACVRLRAAACATSSAQSRSAVARRQALAERSCQAAPVGQQAR